MKINSIITALESTSKFTLEFEVTPEIIQIL